MSLAFRLSAAFVGLITLTALAFGAAAFETAERGVNSQVDNFLEQRAKEIDGGNRGRPDADRRISNNNRSANSGGEDSVDADSVVQVLGQTGEPVISTGFALPVDATDRLVATGELSQAYLRTVSIDGDNYRILTSPLDDGGAVQVARELSESSSAISLIRSQLVPIVLVMALLGAGLGLLLARRITSPLRSLATTVDTVAETGNLDVPVLVKGDDEVGRLASGFENLLATLADSRQHQQQLVQDAAHELRTPLTSVKANIDLLALAPDMGPEDRAQTFTSVRAELNELTQLVNEIVDVATDRFSPQELVDLDLVEVVNESVARFRVRTGRLVEFGAPQSVPVRGDRDSLERAVGNILSNADKYSPVDTPIDVTVTSDRSVVVVDRGSGISPAEQSRVFDRFYRTDEARSQPGSGLGLSIVKSIVDAHGGDVELADGPSGGTAVTITLPLPSA